MTIDRPVNSVLVGGLVGGSSIGHTNNHAVFHMSFCIPCLALLVWGIEYRRRNLGSLNISAGRRLARELVPEMVGLIMLSGLVTVLLVTQREDKTIQEDEAWKEVKTEWPILVTADSLIGLQAMLRLLLLLSASLRRSSALASPLDGEPAAFFLLAALVRVALLALSPADIYRLDGPLGGELNVAIEVTSLLLLLPIGYRILQKGLCRVAGLMVVAVLAVTIAQFNHLALADSTHSRLDKLFSLVMLLEMIAGLAFYVRSSRMKGSDTVEVFTGFAHLFLPFQQALPSYFLLVAFAPPFTVEPALVGKGRPFEVLQVGGVLQIAVYILAAAVYSTSCAEEKQVSSFATPVPAGEAPPADECVICLGSCENCEDTGGGKPRWRRLQCGHHFHESCIFEWLKKSMQCPMCRRNIGDKSGTESATGSPPEIALPMDATATEEGVPLLQSGRASIEL